jgi:hypothetical protein
VCDCVEGERCVSGLQIALGARGVHKSLFKKPADPRGRRSTVIRKPEPEGYYSEAM